MGKHIEFVEDENVNPERKRRKLEEENATVETLEINSPESLKKLLAFRQDATSRLRQNIQLFKKFLDSILYGEEGPDRFKKLDLLLEYVESTIPIDEDQTAILLPDVIQTWSFAAQSNHDGLLSTVPAVLALLLKTISNSITFRKFGIHLCETLLRKDQVKLFNRGITANKSKEHLILPCLRLLSEIVSFDGGRVARIVHAQRDVTFKRLDVFLGMRNQASKPFKGKGKHSIRETALKFLFLNFRFQNKNVKAEILSESKLVRALFYGLSEDSPDVIHEILDSVTNLIVLDDSLPKRIKSRFLTDWTLLQIVRLYEYSGEDVIAEKEPTIRAKAHSFLVFLCTAVDRGILVQQDGWYPPGFEEGTNPIESGSTFAASRLGLQDRYTETVPIRNAVLASFLQGLRPFANVYHKQLVLAIFTVAPELIADYFIKKRNFSFDAKLSATWVGYSSFLFSVIKSIPPPALHDWPPPVAIALESILPQPMSQKVLTRCFNQTIELVTFLTVRLLVAAYQKLETVLQLWRQRNGQQWTKVASDLIDGFCQRCPEPKHIIAAFRRVPSENGMLRESLLRLLALYYKVTPSLALKEKFDVSVILTERLSADTIMDPRNDNVNSLERLELRHLLDIACRSPDIAWWQRPVQLPLSPFTSVLRLFVAVHRGKGGTIRTLLCSLIKEHSILQQESTIPGFDALAVSLADLDSLEASIGVYKFLDNCILRFVRKPIKYCGDADHFAKMFRVPGNDAKPISLLHFVLLEQWAFLVASNDVSILNVGYWSARYIDASRAIGEDWTVLQNIRMQMWKQIKDKQYGTSLEQTSNDSPSKNLVQRFQSSQVSLDRNTRRGVPGTGPLISLVDGDAIFRDLELPREDEDHSGLNRWSTEGVSTAVEDNALTDLIYCLCSEHGEVRKQALINLRHFVAKLKALGDKKYEQLTLLLLEVVESAKSMILDRSFPYFAGALCARSVETLNDPLHFMYTKINIFLNRNPSWNLAKLPSYWLSKILMSPPANDDSHTKEVMWLLETMIEGLRNDMDMELYRRCNVFERILSYAAAPSSGATIREKTLQLIYRCTLVGGSTTLVTRCGILSWIKTQQARTDGHHVTLHGLTSQIHSTCDLSRVNEWSGR